jgi:predicted metal-dependent peptidase
MARLIKNARRARQDWRGILRDFCANAKPNDYSWRKPNRRYLSRGLILPGLKNEPSGRIALFNDISGSTVHIQEDFLAEVRGIQSDINPTLDVFYWDTEDCGHEEFLPDTDEVSFHVRRGGGGTNFLRAHDQISDMAEQPDCIVWLTDGWTSSWPDDVGIPVLWLITDPNAKAPQYGVILYAE